MPKIKALLGGLDELIALHKRNNDMWVDFFEGSRERILKDPAFGCEYLTMAWHGIGGYDDERIFTNDNDEKARLALHPQIYKMASEYKHDKNN